MLKNAGSNKRFYIETQVLLKKNKNKNLSVVDRANKNVCVFN